MTRHPSVTPISLARATPLFRGSAREVFQHPDAPDLFIKVPKPKFRGERPPHWRKRFRPLGGYSISLRELRESVRLSMADGRSETHISTAIGLVRTDIGWGLIVHREQDGSGNLAPTVGQMIDNGRFDEVRPALDRFLLWLESTNAVVQDLHEDNIVFADRNGTPEIVIIDGFGDRSALMLRTYFPYLNKRRMKYFIERFHRKLKLRQSKAAESLVSRAGIEPATT